MTIGSLWIGRPWSFMEQVVAQSYVDAGHTFVLFGDRKPASLPRAAQFYDYRDLLEAPFPLDDTSYHLNGVFSDLFRLVMIRDLEFCWVDMDAYCVKAFDFPKGAHVFASENGAVPDEDIANGVLHLPPDSPALNACIDVFYQDNPPLPFANDRDQREAGKALKRGDPFRIELTAWATSGPRLLTHMLRESGEGKLAMPKDYFYGGMRSRKKPFTTPHAPLNKIELPPAYSVHFYGRTRTFVKEECGGLPPENSYLELICKRHGVDPTGLPIV
ncbi:hypothetical protein [Hasllibacter sp. MH4015]|uniref:hypothetical protein n=1 Tax=Hasllibacter sp. MH4015 TaxID=2854029 RepID=UPI001CD66A24|nr:hypothetical protein [Hasllibacter sp. MH4015]